MNTALKYSLINTTQFAVASHKGMRRLENEDSYAVNEELGLYVVADGMGGHENGKTASTIACKLVVEQIKLGKSVENAHIFLHKNSRFLRCSDGLSNELEQNEIQYILP